MLLQISTTCIGDSVVLMSVTIFVSETNQVHDTVQLLGAFLTNSTENNVRLEVFNSFPHEGKEQTIFSKALCIWAHVIFTACALDNEVRKKKQALMSQCLF
jgi:hypothetical protein